MTFKIRCFSRKKSLAHFLQAEKRKNRHQAAFNNFSCDYSNTIFFLRSYSYYVDVSMDQKDWVRVVDHSKYLCRSWQELYFPPKVVRYIRIVGTHNTVNKVFHVVALEAYYTKKQFLLDPRGILSKFIMSII